MNIANLDNNSKKILILSICVTAILSSIVTYFFTKTNYQEQYYAKQLEMQDIQQKNAEIMNKTYKITTDEGRKY